MKSDVREGGADWEFWKAPEAGDETKAEDHPSRGAGAAPNLKGASPRSEAQRSASRRNGAKSNGPRTNEGRARSSRNALKSGIYSSSAMPITRGAFAEDPDEVLAYVDAIVQADPPTNVLELAQARVIAGLYLRERRLSRFETYLLSARGVLDESDEFSLQRGERLALQLAGEAGLFQALLRNDVREEDVDFKNLTEFTVFELGLQDGVEIDGVWDKDHEPETNDGWRSVFWSVVNHFFPDEASALEWATGKVSLAQDYLEKCGARRGEIAALGLFDESTDRVMKERAMVLKEIGRQVEIYRNMKNDRQQKEATLDARRNEPKT